ncbi:MAG: 5-formyltetrahydrofolate cyclo-ligase [Propionibacteriaceae bacterium]|nr:5-formyltetrahydrofolate cyclo-ligase [Propionibacteriaceae bacterium]
MPDMARKDALRAATRAARARLSPDEWARQDAERTRCALAAVGELPVGTAAVYVSLPGEPDTHALIDGLVARGWTVLIPRLRRQPDWGRFTRWADLTPGWREILQPPDPRLGAEALAEAELILLPCLAVGRDGSRLGTGGGWYDRALLHRRPDALMVALARADEVEDTVPTLAHDIPVHGYVTEHGWVLC